MGSTLYWMGADVHGPHYGWSMRQASAMLLVPDTANDRAALRAAFVGKFVDHEPAIVLQQQISKVRLEDDVEKYLDTLLYLGGKLGMGPDALTRYLIDGLPSQEFKQFVMGTDTHNWQNYSQRARLYFATGYNREATQTSSNLSI